MNADAYMHCIESLALNDFQSEPPHLLQQDEANFEFPELSELGGLSLLLASTTDTRDQGFLDDLLFPANDVSLQNPRDIIDDIFSHSTSPVRTCTSPMRLTPGIWQLIPGEKGEEMEIKHKGFFSSKGVALFLMLDALQLPQKSSLRQPVTGRPQREHCRSPGIMYDIESLRKSTTPPARHDKKMAEQKWSAGNKPNLPGMALGEGSRSDAEDQDWIVLKKEDLTLARGNLPIEASSYKRKRKNQSRASSWTSTLLTKS